MAVGDGSNIAGLGYLAFGRETTFGTGVSSTARLDVLSASIKTTKETKILETVETSRTYSRRISLSKSIEGDVEFYVTPFETSTGFIFQNVFGGTVTSATVTGETTGGGGIDHIFAIGSMAQTYKSLSINQRKGDSASGQIFEYIGARINELTLSAEIDEPLRATISLVCKDSSVTTNDVSAALTQTTSGPLTFDGGRFSVEATFASLTSSTFWHVQNIEFTLSNNLKVDSESRRIGTDVLDVMPPGIANFALSATIRFDTTTAFDAMVSATRLAAEFEFTGDTMTGSVAREGLLLEFPVVYIMDAGDPEVSGPDSVLTSQVTFAVLRDNTSVTGYAVQATLTNNIANYS